MDRPRPLILATLLAVTCIIHANVARAEAPCEGANGLARPGEGTPIRVPIFGPADFGTAQEVCARSRISLESRAALLVAESEFYGTLLAGLALRATFVLPRKTWISLWMPGIESRYVANATVDTTQGSLGAGALGFHGTFFELPEIALVAYGRALLPTETLFTNATRYGIEPGISALYRPGSSVEVPIGIAFPMTFTAGPGTVTSLVAPAFSADVVWRPVRGFGIAGGAAIRPAESFDPRAQLRFYPWQNLQILLAGLFPVAGTDRTSAAVSLSFGWESF